MTITFPNPCETIVTDVGVYAPQHDSRLLADTLQRMAIAEGRRVLDLCTSSGVLAVAAAQSGATEVTAFDICPRAVRVFTSQRRRGTSRHRRAGWLVIRCVGVWSF